MRIVGGKYKGRIFNPGKKFSARPTTDLAKEALFNILENRYNFSDKIILDLFAGTGSISYEFISRGCLHATLVEKHYNHFKFIQSVIHSLAIENANVVKGDVFKFLEKTNQQFNIIFADPPFNLQEIMSIPEKVFMNNVLAKNGLLIIEHPKNIDFSKNSKFTELRKYGKVQFSFFEQ